MEFVEGYTFDDVLLSPNMGVLDSRKDADISTELISGGSLRIPIVSANMQSVTGPAMGLAMDRLGGVGFLHRNNNITMGILDLIATMGDRISVPSVGLDDIERAYYFSKETNLICLDVAHGDHMRVYKFIDQLKRELPKIKLIVGNIATYDAAKRMIIRGVSAVKVGVGPGAACTTRETTGFGVPQLSAIFSVAKAIKDENSDVKLIADGGIRNSGDIVKALAAGADTVMLGRLLAGADESNTPGHYAGSASLHVRDGYRAPEGVSGEVDRTGPAEDTIKSLCWGIKSGLSYAGATNLKELRENARWIKVTSNSLFESNTRI